MINEEYEKAIRELGATLRVKFPGIRFILDPASGVWIVKNQKHMDKLCKKFQYRDDWRRCLGSQNLVVLFYDSDGWVGFTLD